MLVMWAITAEKQGGRSLALLLAMALITQSFLTFSRGGVYNFAIGITAAVLHLIGKPNKFIRGVFIVLIIGLIAGVLILPRLESYTAGALSQRFTDVDITSREVLAQADLNLFYQNPLFGVGPGMGQFLRQGVRVSAAHTEYTRLLSEHGSGGVLALLVLAIFLASRYFKAPDALTRAWVVALAAWPLVEMAHAAMRVVGIALMLGWAIVNWQEKPETEANQKFHRF
jgi:O-antigen ligase